MPKHLFVAVLLFSVLLFKSATNGAIAVASSRPVQKQKNRDSLKKALRDNLDFFARHLLKGYRAVIRNYIRKYQRDTCGILTYKDNDLKAGFEGVKVIKSIFVNTPPIPFL